MRNDYQFDITKIVAYLLLTFGILLTILSTFYFSSFFAILGMGICFWGAVVIYIKKPKCLKIEIFNAVTISALANIENMLAQMDTKVKGKYLPPRFTKDLESSVIFISNRLIQNKSKPQQQFINQSSLNGKQIYITPPGFGLSLLFEKSIGETFAKIDVESVLINLKKAMVEDLELASNINMDIKDGKIIKISISGNLLNFNSNEIEKLPRLYNQLGSPLSSAIACVLAKASGEIVTIQKEENNGEITEIEYKLEGENL